MIDGIKIASKIISELKREKTPKKILAAVLIGSDKASLSFLKQKEKAAAQLGVRFKIIRLSASLPQKGAEKAVRAISNHPSVGGVIVQLPLPKKFDRVGVLNAIGIEKDIDVLNGETSKILAPAAGAIERILKEIKFSPKEKRAVVVGSGLLIGQPATKWLMQQTKKLTVLNRGAVETRILQEADLIITGTGVSNLIKGSEIKVGAVVIDFGYGKKNGTLAGDIEVKSVAKKTKWFTPTPGGTGPIVVAMLLANFFKLNSR